MRLRRLSGCSADFAMQERKKRFDVGNQKREAEEARATRGGRGRDGVRQERDYVVKTDVRRRPAVVPIGR